MDVWVGGGVINALWRTLEDKLKYPRKRGSGETNAEVKFTLLLMMDETTISPSGGISHLGPTDKEQYKSILMLDYQQL